MINIESEIFTSVATALRSAFTGITVYGETVLSPSKFPCVCIEETDNHTYLKGVDSGLGDNFVEVTYEVNVYTDKQQGKKTQAKEIFATLDNVLANKGFIRRGTNPITLDDSTKYRLFGRYTAIVGKDNNIYGGN